MPAFNEPILLLMSQPIPATLRIVEHGCADANNEIPTDSTGL
jgi:hypothetical protein